MADIELVVKIPEEIYDYIHNEHVAMRVCDSHQVASAIANGTPLTKGHGRIGDLDKLIKRVTNLPKCPNGHSKMYDEAMIINIINEELAIIEADTESEG